MIKIEEKLQLAKALKLYGLEAELHKIINSKSNNDKINDLIEHCSAQGYHPITWNEIETKLCKPYVQNAKFNIPVIIALIICIVTNFIAMIHGNGIYGIAVGISAGLFTVTFAGNVYKPEIRQNDVQSYTKDMPYAALLAIKNAMNTDIHAIKVVYAQYENRHGVIHINRPPIIVGYYTAMYSEKVCKIFDFADDINKYKYSSENNKDV